MHILSFCNDLISVKREFHCRNYAKGLHTPAKFDRKLTAFCSFWLIKRQKKAYVQLNLRKKLRKLNDLFPLSAIKFTKVCLYDHIHSR